MYRLQEQNDCKKVDSLHAAPRAFCLIPYYAHAFGSNISSLRFVFFFLINLIFLV